MGAGTAVLIAASRAGSLGLFVGGFTALFVLSGIGNGSTYKMIPGVFAQKAEREVTGGRDAAGAFARARRMSGAVIAIAGAVGALGGAVINLAFKLSYADGSGSGTPAFLAFLGYYVLCVAVIRLVYLRRGPAETGAATGDVRETSRV